MYVIVHIWPDAGYGMPAPTIMPGPVYADYAEANQAAYDYCCGDDVGVREGHRYYAVELRAEMPEPSYPSDAAYARARALIAAEKAVSDAGTAYCEECGKTPCCFQEAH